MPPFKLVSHNLTKLLNLVVFVIVISIGSVAQEDPLNIIKLSLPNFFNSDTSTKIKFIPAKLQRGSELLINNPRKLSSYDTCKTSTFYIHVSAAAGQLIDLKEVQTLPNGNFIFAGNVTLPNSEQEGLITILANDGTMISQKQIRVNSKPTTLSGLKVLLDGRILITGIMHDATDKVFVSLLNSNLSTAWLKIFDQPSTPLKVVVDLVESDQIAFAVQMNSSVVYALMKGDGSLAWSRQVSSSGMDELAGFTQLLWSELGLVINCTRSGLKVVDLIRISQSNGTILSSSTFCDASTQNKYSDINTFNARLITAGITKNSANQFKVVRNITATTPNTETEHTYTLPAPVDFSSRCATDNSGDIIGISIPQSGKLFFIKHFASYQSWPEHTKEYAIPTGATLVAIARSFADGGYLFGLNTSTAGEIILIKTDSTGTLPGCGFINHPNNSAEILNKPNTPFSIVQSNISLIQNTSSVITTSTTLAVQTDCNQIFCPPEPMADTCLNTYHKTFRSNSYVDAFNNYYLVKDNKQVVTSSRYDRILGNFNQVTSSIKLFDEAGKYIKGFDLYHNGVSAGAITRQFDDQRIMLIHRSTDNGIPQYTFTLINDDLQIIWSKSIRTFAGYNFVSGLTMGDIVRDTQGNFYFMGNNLGFMENGKLLVYKMDPLGNQVWVNIYEIPNSLFLTCNATVTHSSLIVAIEGSSQGSVSVRIDKNSGLVLNAYRYNNWSSGSLYDRFFEFDNDRIFYVGDTYTSSNFEQSMVLGIFDTTGKPLKFKKMNQVAGAGAVAMKSGHIYGQYHRYANSVFRDVLFKVDTGLNFKYANELNMEEMRISGMGISDNGYIYVGGNRIYGNVNSSYVDPVIRKYDPDGLLGTCQSMQIFPDVVSMNLTVTNPVIFQNTNSFTPISIPVVFVPDTSGQRISDILCSSVSLCDTIAVTGPILVCDTTQAYMYNAIKNPGCTIAPLWQYDTSFMSIQSYNDTSITVKFRKIGTTWLKAKLNTGCNIFVDSTLITIYSIPANFTLGNDTLLCPNTNIILNAGNSFDSYLWQNGSTNSTLAVSAPGQYSIVVSNLCGSLLRDTILISPAIVPSLSIGNDSTVCTGDTLRITASPGFATYNWQPIPLFIGQGQQVNIVSAQSVSVSLIATTFDGCKSYDTLNITNIFPRPVNIGNDTSFCFLDSVTLSANPGYLEYNWSTGSQSPLTTVKQAGPYWVIAKDVNGCFARDTMIVQQVYSLPAFSLGNDFNLCAGQQRTLDPGNYQKYVWQDGSTTRYFNVSATGSFWVKVTDNNNCSSTDTVLLKEIFQPPANFLKPSDSLCQFDKITIGPSANYSSYSWSTGSMQKLITVEKGGPYMLTVKDNNGCSATDTTRIIEKICYTGVYIPTAFTPNNDGLNDLFRARVYGKTTSFKLEVYNRYGEKIFETTDPGVGWNGIYKGTPQSTAVFVWQCFYQLTGEKSAFKKGTVVLIR